MKPPFSYGFPMVFLWFSYGFPMVFLWFSYGFPMVPVRSRCPVPESPLHPTQEASTNDVLLSWPGMSQRNSQGDPPRIHPGSNGCGRIIGTHLTLLYPSIRSNPLLTLAWRGLPIHGIFQKFSLHFSGQKLWAEKKNEDIEDIEDSHSPVECHQWSPSKPTDLHLSIIHFIETSSVKKWEAGPGHRSGLSTKSEPTLGLCLKCIIYSNRVDTFKSTHIFMHIDTADGCEILHHLGCLKPYTYGINHPSTGAGVLSWVWVEGEDLGARVLSNPAFILPGR